MPVPPDLVVTIGRQVGAGGREIGPRLAAALGVPFYDRELLAEAARRSGLCEEVLSRHDERPAGSALFHAGLLSPYPSDFATLGQQAFLAQFDAIRELAAKGPCVILGRCADFVLAGRPHVVRAFLRAPLEWRIPRVMARSGVDESAARRMIRDAEKARAAYYGHFTDRKWGDPASYDLVLDTSRLSPDGAVSVLKAFAAAAN